jgi:hypothetical protein
VVRLEGGQVEPQHNGSHLFDLPAAGGSRSARGCPAAAAGATQPRAALLPRITFQVNLFYSSFARVNKGHIMRVMKGECAG